MINCQTSKKNIQQGFTYNVEDRIKMYYVVIQAKQKKTKQNKANSSACTIDHPTTNQAKIEKR